MLCSSTGLQLLQCLNMDDCLMEEFNLLCEEASPVQKPALIQTHSKRANCDF